VTPEVHHLDETAANIRLNSRIGCYRVVCRRGSGIFLRGWSRPAFDQHSLPPFILRAPPIPYLSHISLHKDHSRSAYTTRQQHPNFASSSPLLPFHPTFHSLPHPVVPPFRSPQNPHKAAKTEKQHPRSHNQPDENSWKTALGPTFLPCDRLRRECRVLGSRMLLVGRLGRVFREN